MAPNPTRHAFTHDQMTRHSDDYRCSAEVRGSFRETAPRKTAENNVKHRNGGVGLVVANRGGGSESSVVVTTLVCAVWLLYGQHSVTSLTMSKLNALLNSCLKRDVF